MSIPLAPSLPMFAALPPSAAAPKTDVAIKSELSRVRQQVALVRTLLDEVENRVPTSALDPTAREQLVEELARLAQQLLAAAASLG